MDTHRAAGWARNSNVMWLFAGALLVATFAVGIVDPAGDVGESILAINLLDTFKSSTLGAVFALALGCALIGVVFALISWVCNQLDKTERTQLVRKIQALFGPGASDGTPAAASASASASEEHTAGEPQ